MLLVREKQPSDVGLEDQIKVLVDADMQTGVFVGKAVAEIREELDLGKSLVAFWGQEIVGYVSYRDWGQVIEIMTIFVKEEYRSRGIGQYLGGCIFFKIKNSCPSKKIVVLPNKLSKPIFEKLGFCYFSKAIMPDILRDACGGCPEKNNFPICHCNYMEYLRPQKVYFEVLSDITKSQFENQYIHLYQQVWRFAPWYEDWSLDEVVSEVEGYKTKRNPVFILAYCESRLLGFCCGYSASSNSELSQKLTAPDVDFYISEFAVISGARLHGLGNQLLQRMIESVRSLGIKHAYCRTKSREAIHLFEKNNFQQLDFTSDDDNQRHYFKLEL